MGNERHLLYFIIQRGNCSFIVKSLLFHQHSNVCSMSIHLWCNEKLGHLFTTLILFTYLLTQRRKKVFDKFHGLTFHIYYSDRNTNNINKSKEQYHKSTLIE